MSDLEEFEFKPLTEGLGFHKKAATIKADILASNLGATALAEAPISTRSTSIFDQVSADFEKAPARESGRAGRSETTKTASQSISELMASLPPSLDFLDDKPDLTRGSSELSRLGSNISYTVSSQTPPTAPGEDRPQIFQPLAREDYKNTLKVGPTVGSVLPAPGTKAGGILQSSQTLSAASVSPSAPAIAVPTLGSMTSAANAPYRERMNAGFAKAFPQTEKNKTVDAAAGIVPVAANFAASIIDAMVVTGIATILLVCIITITKINLIALLSNASTDVSTQLNLVLLFATVLQMYMLIARGFFGSSLGEWAFDLQMGTSQQQRTLLYPLQVVLRTTVTTLTGLIILPLLSFAFNRDLARYLTGIQLFRRL